MLSDEATLIENAHLGDWSPEKDCCWQLTFQQPVYVGAIFIVKTTYNKFG